MQNAMMNLLLVISNGLGLKSVGYCFQFLEFHTYVQQQQNSFHNSAIYSTYVVLYISHNALFSTLQLYGKYSTLFLFDPPTQNTLYIYIYIYL